MTKSTFPAVRCKECGALYGHEPDICRECRGESLEVTSISGHGEVYAQTTIRVPGSDHQGEEPFVVALVDVGDTEKVRVTARIDDAIEVSPTDPVTFVERRNETFFFRTE